MSNTSPSAGAERDEHNLLESKSIGRREFLKIAGLASAAVGIGGGLGGILAACGGGATTTTASTSAPSTTGSTAVTTAPSSTTSASAEAGRDVKVGVVAPMTGMYAAFSPSVNWQVTRWKEAVASGVVAGDGKNHKLVITVSDTQSDTNRASQVTGDLINNDKVDVVFSAGSPDTVDPSADQCEALGVPSISSFAPWQSFLYGRGGSPDKPFKWTYGQLLGLEQVAGTFIDMWDQVPTNKKVGGLWPNTSDGMAGTDPKTGYPPIIAAAGYQLTLPSLYPPGLEDFTAQITEFKKVGCEISTGATDTPDFANFWKQAVQQGFHPKIMTIGLALLFPEAAAAIGDIVVHCTTELVWHRSWPFKSSLTGETCQQLADDYEKRSGGQWSPALAQYSRMEWFVERPQAHE